MINMFPVEFQKLILNITYIIIIIVVSYKVIKPFYTIKKKLIFLRKIKFNNNNKNKKVITHKWLW